jgi:uncharacterized membrane protein
MPIHFRSRYNNLREGIWFLPSALIFSGFLLGNFMVRLDERVYSWEVARMSGFFPGNAEWAKSVLTTAAASIGAAITLIISVTIVTLTLASQQFGPRLLRNFLRDNTTKAILGIFFATGLFGFIVRFRVQVDFIPYLSLTLMAALSILDMFLLILFVHHISLSIHVSNVMARVTSDFSSAVERLFPQKLLQNPPAAKTLLQQADIPPDFDQNSHPIVSNESGYIQHIDYEYLLTLAEEKDVILKILRRPGGFIIEGTPLASVWPSSAYEKNLCNKVNDSIFLGNERTLTQDVEFAINQLVEIAVRALSPAINDPFTAIRCLKRLAQGLVELAHSQMPSPYLYDSNLRLRLIIRTITFPKMVNASFSLIRQNGLNSPMVMITLLEVLGEVASFVDSEEDREALRNQAEMALRGSQKILTEEFDFLGVQTAYEETMKRLNPSPALNILEGNKSQG